MTNEQQLEVKDIAETWGILYNELIYEHKVPWEYAKEMVVAFIRTTGLIETDDEIVDENLSHWR